MTTVMFPDPNAPLVEKEKPAYFLQYVQAAMSTFLNFGGAILYNNRINYETNYNYANDNQPVNIYKQQLDCEETANGEVQATNVNINWKPFPIMSKLIDIMTANILQQEYDAICTPLDAEYKEQRELLKAKMIVYRQNEELLSNFGMSQLGFNPAEVPETKEEIEEYMDAEYKEGIAIEAEETIARQLNKNDYFTSIRKYLVREAIITGYECKDVRKVGGMVKIKPLMTKQVFAAQSVFDDYSNIPWGGYMENMTFDQFKLDSQGQFKPDELEKIEKNFSEARNITDMIMYSRQYTNTVQQEKFIKVATFYFKSVINKRKEVKSNKYGNKFVRDLTKKEYKDVNGKVIEDMYEVVFEGKWIVGSEYCYNYKIMNDMEVNRLNEKQAILPLQIVATKQINGRVKAVVENSIPILDEICMAWYQFQNSVRRYVPDGYEIDIAQMVEMANTTGRGGKKFSVADQVRAFSKTGILAVNKKNNNQKAIYPTNNTSMEKLSSWLTIMDVLVEKLRLTTGLNDASDGTNPAPNALVGVQQIAYQSSLNAIAHIAGADQVSFLKLCQSIVFLQKGINLKTWDIQLSLRPTKLQWDELYARAWQAVDAGTLDASDVFKLQEMVNLKRARRYFAARQKQKAIQKQQEGLANIEAQAQANQQAAILIEQEKQKTLQLEFDYAIKKMNRQAEIDDMLQANKYKGEEGLAIIDSKGRVDASQVQANAKVIGHVNDSDTKLKINAENNVQGD